MGTCADLSHSKETLSIREGLELNTAAAQYISEIYGPERFLEDMRSDHVDDGELAEVLGVWQLVSWVGHSVGRLT